MTAIDIKSFRSAFNGQVYEPSDAGYNEARQIWNASISKRPRVIARCSGVADVIAAVNFARANNLLTAILGYSDLVLAGDPPEDVRQNVEEVHKAADRAAALTRQLLAFSRKQVLQPRILELNDVVKKGSNACARVAASMPCPVSETSRRT